jgi:penicillin amidase
VPTDGSWPLPGWTSAYDWKGYLDLADLPSRLDPQEGFVVAANQAVTPPGGKVTITGTADYGYRSQRIRELITSRTSGGAKLTVADMEAIQADTRNGMASVLVPLLMSVPISDSFYADPVKLLRGWDGTQDVDSAPAAFFNAVWASLLELTFDDELPEGSRPDGGGRWFEVVRALLQDPNDAWWDDRGTPSVIESRDEIIRRAVVRARDRLTSRLGKDPSTWSWGRLHRLDLRSWPLGSSSATSVIHPLLDEGPIELPGGTSIVDAQGWDAAAGDFDVVSAPSMRMVVDLDDLDRSRWVNQTGQSGHPGQAHYTDQVDAWAHGRTFAWPSSPDAVRAAAAQTLVLDPAGP